MSLPFGDQYLMRSVLQVQHNILCTYIENAKQKNISNCVFIKNSSYQFTKFFNSSFNITFITVSNCVTASGGRDSPGRGGGRQEARSWGQLATSSVGGHCNAERAEP